MSTEPDALVAAADGVDQQRHECHGECQAQQASDTPYASVVHCDGQVSPQLEQCGCDTQPVSPALVVGDTKGRRTLSELEDIQVTVEGGSDSKEINDGKHGIDVLEDDCDLESLWQRGVKESPIIHAAIVPGVRATGAIGGGRVTFSGAYMLRSVIEEHRDEPIEPGSKTAQAQRAPSRHSRGGGLIGDLHIPTHHHRNMQGGGARAAVFGVSDGLVTNVSLILGMAGAHPTGGVVRLAGVAGLIGGAFSMAAGEYVSMRAQRELVERELDLERHEIQHRPEGERRELVRIYEDRGIESRVAHEMATEVMRDPDVALETHAREELGISPDGLGSPVQAAVASFATFGFGALLPLLPWLFTTGNRATVMSVVIGIVAALGVGAGLAFFTGRRWWWSATRQLLIAILAAGVTYLIGHTIGISSLS